THDRTLLPTPSRPNHSLSEGRVEAATAGAGSRSWGADGSVVNGSCSCSWSALLQYWVHLEFCVSDAGVLVGCGVSDCVCVSSGARCCWYCCSSDNAGPWRSRTSWARSVSCELICASVLEISTNRSSRLSLDGFGWCFPPTSLIRPR